MEQKIISCKHCKRKLSVAAGHRMLRVTCPVCGQSFMDTDWRIPPKMPVKKARPQEIDVRNSLTTFLLKEEIREGFNVGERLYNILLREEIMSAGMRVDADGVTIEYYNWDRSVNQQWSYNRYLFKNYYEKDNPKYYQKLTSTKDQKALEDELWRMMEIWHNDLWAPGHVILGPYRS